MEFVVLHFSIQSQPSMQLNARQSELFARVRDDPLYLQYLRRSDFDGSNDWIAVCSFAIERNAAAIQFLKPRDFGDVRDWYSLARKAVRGSGAAIRHLKPSDFAQREIWHRLCETAVSVKAWVIREIPSLTLDLAQRLAASRPQVIQHMSDADCLTWLAEALTSSRDAAAVLYPCLNEALGRRIKSALMFASCAKQQRHDAFAGAILKHAFDIPNFVWMRTWAALTAS